MAKGGDGVVKVNRPKVSKLLVDKCADFAASKTDLQYIDGDSLLPGNKLLLKTWHPNNLDTEESLNCD